jgi:hypothetical protein
LCTTPSDIAELAVNCQRGDDRPGVTQCLLELQEWVPSLKERQVLLEEVGFQMPGRQIAVVA